MKKKNGGTIKNWQIHTLTYSKKDMEQLKKMYPTALTKPNPMVFTGTVVEDKAGRWKPGDHMRSSLICKITKTGKNTGLIETQNTIYKVINEGGDIFPNIGNDALNIFY